MKVDDALKGVQRLYVETPPLIYFVEANPTYVDRMSFIIDHLEQSDTLRAVSSVITLAEVLMHPIKENKPALVREYQDILINSAEFSLMPVTVSVAQSAARYRAHYNLRTPDALHVATAIDAGCDAFLTNDLGLRRVTDLTILVLDELELPAVGG